MSVPDEAKLIDLPPRTADDEDTETTGSGVLVRLDDSDPTPQQSLRIIDAAGTLDFWDDPSEDIYTTDNGDPV